MQENLPTLALNLRLYAIRQDSLLDLIGELCEMFADLVWKKIVILRSECSTVEVIENYSPVPDADTDATIIKGATNDIDPILSAIANGISLHPELIDWGVWDLAFVENLATSKRHEEVAIVGRLDGLGYMEKGAVEIGLNLEKLNLQTFNRMSDMTTITRSMVFSLNLNNEGRVTGILGTQVQKRNSARQRWEGILEVSERNERALMRTRAMDPARNGYRHNIMATSTTKLTHSIFLKLA